MAFGILDCKKMEVVPGTGEQLFSSPQLLLTAVDLRPAGTPRPPLLI
jgi:hypothetical protein